MKVYTEICKLAFIVLADILDGVNVKWDSETVDWEDDGLRFLVDVDLTCAAHSIRSSAKPNMEGLTLRFSISLGNPPSPL